MTFFTFLLLASVYIRAALGGALKVLDYDGQCVIWSDDNHGCTGYSASFGLLDGDSCADISKVTHGTRTGYSRLYVDTCGKIKDLPVAWIEVNKDGVVKIFNRKGEESGCKLKNGLKVGSSCIASNIYSSASSTSSTSASESSSSTSSTSESSVSGSSSSTSSPSASESSSSTSSTSESSVSGSSSSTSSTSSLSASESSKSSKSTSSPSPTSQIQISSCTTSE